ncbi:MarR family transcriptional regulator [Verrucosispora sioxanthis]|uniref:MarR family transcriptional regulator n=1 Tax=Verrucosispora sioxanthis TaxID=2499994 RepID=UPI00359FCACC
MDRALVDVVRRFNRTVTQRLGALDDSYLARDRPLAQSRLLWEIGPGGAEVAALRTRLDLDAGYLSRLLRTLEGAGLVRVGPAEDRPPDRRRPCRVAPAGRQVRRAGLVGPRAAHRRPTRPAHPRHDRGRAPADGVAGHHRTLPSR